MATIGRFVEGYAAAVGCEYGQALKLQRLLRDADLFTSGARGVNAPEPTFLDAARMLIAHAVTSRPVLAVSAVQEFGCLPSHLPLDGWRVDPEWRAVGGAATLEDALAEALKTAAELSADDRKLFVRAARLEVSPHALSGSLEVQAGVLLFRRYDLLRVIASQDEAAISHALTQDAHARELGARFAELGGIQVTRAIGGGVMAAIADLIAEAPAIAAKDEAA